MAFVAWFTGLPGCGKTTIASAVKARLLDNGIDVKILQLDEIRKVITPDPKYTNEERDIVYASLAYMAKLLSETGVNVIIDATANKRSYRDLARKLVPNFIEVYISADIVTCMAREAERKAQFAPKDIYKNAVLENATVPGVNVAYEAPINPEIEVDSYMVKPGQSAEFISKRILDMFGGK
jgi:adenylylsulfate kinase